jgi:hypothetical protein
MPAAAAAAIAPPAMILLSEDHQPLSRVIVITGLQGQGGGIFLCGSHFLLSSESVSLPQAGRQKYKKSIEAVC